MSGIDPNQLLGEMRAQIVQAQGNVAKPTDSVGENSQSFGKVLSEQLSYVNQLSLEKSKLQEQFVLGDPNVSLPQMMVASQKSSIATAFLIETRNKVVDAYNQVMSMSV